MWLTCMFMYMMLSNDLIKFVIESIIIWFMLFTLKWFTLTLALTFSFDFVLYTLYFVLILVALTSVFSLIWLVEMIKANQTKLNACYIILFLFLFFSYSLFFWWYILCKNLFLIFFHLFISWFSSFVNSLYIQFSLHRFIITDFESKF